MLFIGAALAVGAVVRVVHGALVEANVSKQLNEDADGGLSVSRVLIAATNRDRAEIAQGSKKAWVRALKRGQQIQRQVDMGIMPDPMKK